jgi:serine/threonine protein kinase/tetratricopeptide (TPR) repeat protein
MIGRTVSHYRIVGQLGSGGMGVVYEAEDTRLGRRVALKLLRPDIAPDTAAHARFLQEARAASALDHPNICTVYESGETDQGQAFLAMAHCAGESLDTRIARGPLAVSEAVDLAAQIGEGLAEAHAHAIVHRDIKPANVLLTQSGRVKIVDFGLALLAEGSAVTTGAGVAVGTLAYMSPEQARGETADARADLWALGVVLYEMLAGRRPFTGETAAAALYAILNTAPPPLDRLRADLPPGVSAIVNRALTKDLFRRYQHAEQMLADLHAAKSTLAAPGAGRVDAPPRIPSIAVLPFADLSPGHDQEFFCDGIAEELINSLGAVGGIRIVSRTSSAQFKGQAQDIRRIGEQLNVNAVLEGSVRKADNRLRVTAQLVNASDGYHLWSERYDRTLDDVFAVQEDIARTIVEKLKGRLSRGSEPVARQLTRSVEAYQHYLRGRYHYERRHGGTLKDTIACFDAAIRADPNFAAAHAGLAEAYALVFHYGFEPAAVVVPKARAAVERAFALDDSLAESHLAIGIFKLFVDFDFDGLEQSFVRAEALNPTLALVHAYHAMALSLTGRSADVRHEMSVALALEPLSPVVSYGLGVASYVARNCLEAVQHADRILALEPDHTLALWLRGLALSALGQSDEAIADTGRAVALSGRHMYFLAIHGIALGRAGRTQEVRAVLDELRTLGPSGGAEEWGFVHLHAVLGEEDEALDALDRLVSAGYPGTPLMLARPELDQLRAHPRFIRLVKQWLGDSPVVATLLWPAAQTTA